MDIMVLLCIGMIVYLLYRVNGQKNQLTYLTHHLEKLQQHLATIQKQIVNKDEVADQPVVPHETKQSDTVQYSVAQDDSVSKKISDPWQSDVELNDQKNKIEHSQFGISQPASEEIDKASSIHTNKNKGSHQPEEFTLSEKIFAFVFNGIKNYFSQGNQIVRVAIIVLFFGVSFLAKYSIENSLVPIEIRMSGIIIGAMIMLLIGWRLRLKNPAYGLIMQGGGIAVSYLAIFASFKLYQLIPAEVAFPILILFSILAMFLAIVQDSKALAITAITGGFASPIFASTGAGSHVGLFSYYLVLNCAIFSIAWFKSWRLLNVIGFAFTFIIASIWGVSQYRSANFSSTEPFLIVFFLIYVAISILFSIKQQPNLKGYVDGTLVFGLPVVCFGLQTGLVHHIEYGLAFSSGVLAIFYLCISLILRQSKNPHLLLLTQAMTALSVIFATLTIPFALDGKWTAASWALEGVGFIWIAIKQKREILKYIGLGIQLVGGLIFLAEPYGGEAFVFLNSEFMSVSILTLSALFSAHLLQLDKDNNADKSIENNNEPLDALSDFKHKILAIKTLVDSVAGVALIAWGLAWWYIGAFIDVNEHAGYEYKATLYVAFLAVSSMLWLFLSQRWNWKQFNFFPWLSVLPLCLYFWPTIFSGHFLENYGYISWPFALGSLYYILYKAKLENYSLFKPTALHSVSYLLTLCIICYEAAWLIDDMKLTTAWPALAVMVVLICGLLFATQKRRWPVSDSPYAYHVVSAFFIILAMCLWSFIFNFISVLKPIPMVYIPLINPIDLIQLVGLWVVIKWHRQHGEKINWLASIDKRWVLGTLAMFVFIWFNVLLLKTVHVITLVPYTAQALFDSAVVQTSLSIAWTIIGLLVMVLASVKGIRPLWLVGAGLTAIVVIKLFTLDLDGQGTIERIISFLVVGGLLLVVGYLSPVPPALESKAATE